MGDMLAPLLATFILIFTITYGRVLLYNVENQQMLEKFDCVYYMYSYGEEISYCRRPGGSLSLNRTRNECDNQGEKKYFRDLLDQKINPNEILDWSSSVEMADLYASVFYNRSLLNGDDDRFLCNCTKTGTFGRYCEYQLTHSAKSFRQAIEAQFEQKEQGDSWNTQRYGKILCYETLPCISSPLCLDWREICDGVQRCINGIDEENCDKLEFNECEDDEFRCTNGMCIAQEFWLDGDFDCMDRSDEFVYGNGVSCPFQPNAMECDERVSPLKSYYSCGDGEFVPWNVRMAFQRYMEPGKDCFSKRNLNYMCEASSHQPAWTLESGLCWPDNDYDDPRYPPWNMINASNLTNDRKCQYLFRCAFSKGFEHDCPCNHQNCTQMMMDVCSDPYVLYPPFGLINPNIYVFYNYSQSMEDPHFATFVFFGGIKCRGYFFDTRKFYSVEITHILLMATAITNHILCTIVDPNHEYQNSSSPIQNHKFCWNDSLAFNGRPYAVNPEICNYTGECISQYRIHDGFMDCIDGNDEAVVHDKNYCAGNVGRHRFQCFNDQHKCLPLMKVGNGAPSCSNSYDISWYGMGGSLQIQFPCFKHLTADCHLVKTYIQQSSAKNSSNNTSRQESTNRISFRSYCDSFWDLDEHVDELSSSCQHWVCQHDQYQCKTGQCIPLDWVCDGEWDCSDASDEEAIILTENWLIHNLRLNLISRFQKCVKLYSKSPFSTICDESFEFGCYLSQVGNPLDIQSNRPCINLTQIGDGVEDCYNAYDEKNTFRANSYAGGMWGFHFRCNSKHKIYLDSCSIENCTETLCSKHRDKNGSCSGTKDFICLGDDHCKKNARCNGIIDCFHGEDEYWCAPGSFEEQLQYRGKKKHPTRLSGLLWYPPKYMLETSQEHISNSTIKSREDSFFKAHSYQCNRGVTVLQKNETQCLCPPAYYGRWCEFFSDRISIIAHFDQKSLPATMSNVTVKIRAKLLFRNVIFDDHEFDVASTFERAEIIKNKFYLLFSRSAQILQHKLARYLNRKDIINNQPYSVHFDVFHLTKNSSVEELGSWHYPIYFDYLPASRLAIVLRFPSWFGNTTFDPCSQNTCNANSNCVPIFNQNNSFCSCKSGYYGTNCTMYELRCETYCLINALCRPDHYSTLVKRNNLYCICPLGHFGPRCNLKYDDCNSHPCLNNGICLSNYDRSGEESYVCNCSKQFYGNQCQHQVTSVSIALNMTRTLTVRATVLQFYDIMYMDLPLSVQHQQVYYDLPLMISYYHSRVHAPLLGVLKIYEDFSHPQYFIMYFLNRTRINITSSPQQCPHALSLLSEGSERDQYVPAVFKYHHICRKDAQRYCFYDENYLCICQSDRYRAECFMYDTQLDHCHKCLSGGKCLQGDPQNSSDFICLCPDCHYGRRCEFSTRSFGFTVDSLLAADSKQIQIIYASIVGLLFAIGLFNNFCSFLTFKRPSPRKSAVGNYLLVVTCLSQIALFCLLCKFIQIVVGISNLESCKAISYLLSVITRSTYWLTSWITIDRLFIIVFPTSSVLHKPRLSIGVSIITLIALFGMHVHEIIYYTVIQHLSTGSPFCVTNFDIIQVSTYNRISTLIHHLLPFSIQIMCITFLIALVARSRTKTIGRKMNFGEMLKKQFQSQKELYITPTIIILSALPQAIFTFSFACTQLTDWQRHTLLGTYLLSYAPQILGFFLFVMPSTSYKKDFGETLLAKKCFKLMFDKEKSNITVSKTKTFRKR